MNLFVGFRSGVRSPKGASHASPGQRPGLALIRRHPALKGRSNRYSMASARCRPGPPLQGFGRWAANPRALPWADITTAPLGLRAAHALRAKPNDAFAE
jgi:hypothetical protein